MAWCFPGISAHYAEIYILVTLGGTAFVVACFSGV